MSRIITICLIAITFIIFTHFGFILKESVPISALHLLGQYEVPNGQLFKNTTIGGISGIDYIPITDEYLLISDDRSAFNPVRYYTSKILFTPKGIDTVQFVNVHYFFQEDGNVYPDSKTNPSLAPDPEAIRYNPATQQLVWINEGERSNNQDKIVLQDPAINISGLDGKYLGVFSTASNMRMLENEQGPRQNGALEGLAFAHDYKSLFASMEEPLYQDGPRADVINTQALVRIYKYDVATKKNIAQYAYELDVVAFPSAPATSFKTNGIPEILSIEENKLLVMERSFSTGRKACTIKLFIADLTHASNIMSVASLKENPPTRLIEKKLLLNMDTLGIYIDNIEGVTFGPRLANGHQTLIFVSDDNFSALQKTQFLLFEVIP